MKKKKVTTIFVLGILGIALGFLGRNLLMKKR